ncbi:hypothetical protein FIV07_09285 [Mycobacterium sp. THAF192]|nr:hypothetical protein FIV07_09285 [Mycobacterium sp. THAF192]
MYFRALLAQAGVAHGEFAPGEDYLAVDVNVDFPAGSVRAQIKTGTKRVNKDGSITVPVTDTWKAKWSEAQIPVFLVYVKLGASAPTKWITHSAAHTIVGATALWTQVNSVTGQSVRVPAENRLTATTFDAWVDEFKRNWGRAASA